MIYIYQRVDGFNKGLQIACSGEREVCSAEENTYMYNTIASRWKRDAWYRDCFQAGPYTDKAWKLLRRCTKETFIKDNFTEFL